MSCVAAVTVIFDSCKTCHGVFLLYTCIHTAVCQFELNKRKLLLLLFYYVCMYVCMYVCISIAPLPVHYYSEALPTTAMTQCRSKHAEAPQTIASEGLAQGPYAAARVGFEPATLGSQGTERRPYYCATTPFIIHNPCGDKRFLSNEYSQHILTHPHGHTHTQIQLSLQAFLMETFLSSKYSQHTHTHTN